MARTDTLINFLTDVAAAIKAKKGDNTAIPAANFDTEIANLPSGSGDNTILISLINRSVTSIEIPEGMTIIGDSAFNSCTSLTSIAIPNSVTSIGNAAFSSCFNLTSITIPDGVTSIGNGAFSFCSGLTSITIPNSVISIDERAFSNCISLTSITIPDGVTSISNLIFLNCTGLTSITIGNSVTNIGQMAFSNCTSLTEIDFSTHTTVPTLYSADAFSGTPASLVIKVPSALVDEWKAATNWTTYADKIVGV